MPGHFNTNTAVSKHYLCLDILTQILLSVNIIYAWYVHSA